MTRKKVVFFCFFIALVSSSDGSAAPSVGTTVSMMEASGTEAVTTDVSMFEASGNETDTTTVITSTSEATTGTSFSDNATTDLMDLFSGDDTTNETSTDDSVTTTTLIESTTDTSLNETTTEIDMFGVTATQESTESATVTTAVTQESTEDITVEPTTEITSSATTETTIEDATGTEAPPQPLVQTTADVIPETAETTEATTETVSETTEVIIRATPAPTETTEVVTQSTEATTETTQANVGATSGAIETTARIIGTTESTTAFQDECSAGTDNCDTNAFCQNTASGFTCTCNNGYTGNGVVCNDINECTNGADNCNRFANCRNTVGSFTCACSDGYTGDGVNCMDIDECTTGSNNCAAEAICSNTGGSFFCECDTGFDGNGVTCTDNDECAVNTDNNCNSNAACSNNVGSFSCFCNTGFSGDGLTCNDVDECESSPCAAEGGVCTNTFGSFTCSCDNSSYGDGFTCTRCPSLTFNVLRGINVLFISIQYTSPETQVTFNTSYLTNNQNAVTSNGMTGTVFINNLNPGDEVEFTATSSDTCQVTNSITTKTVGQCTQICTNAFCVFNETGTRMCKCREGFEFEQGSQLSCEQVSVCDRIQCEHPFFCSGMNNGCVCPRGFIETNNTCEASQEVCLNNTCRNQGTCSSPDGFTVICACKIGYAGKFCEIYTSPCRNPPCLNGGHCIDENQSFGCVCADGYQGDLCGDDVDECQDPNSCDPNARCTNTNGSFTCSCNNGFREVDGGRCLRIILFPYGEDFGDTQLPVQDDVASIPDVLDSGIPFGETSFNSIRTTSNGIITLGISQVAVQYLYLPPPGILTEENGLAILAPFWDDFQPSPNNDGRVYYQAYNTREYSLNSASQMLVNDITQRIQDRFNRSDFEPFFFYKATWSKVIMYPASFEGYNLHPSTFQAVLATDSCDTYVIYLYEEEGMLWDTTLRFSNIALIGYTNGEGFFFNETQSEYRPDARMQREGGVSNGEYFYQLTPSTKSSRQQARCGCLRWYKQDMDLPSLNPSDTCPCSRFQARRDWRFVRSVDFWFNLINRFYSRFVLSGFLRSANVSEWEYDVASFGNCYQRFTAGEQRCCYLGTSRRRSNGPLFRGSFGSRTERYQMPFFELRNDVVYFRNESLFNEQLQLAMDGDLIPRRQCCIESQSENFCQLYQERRPAPTCTFYRPLRFAFFFGDPHITTIDEAGYTFNGLGEYFMVYAPDVFTLQARTRSAIKEDGNVSDATVFAAFAAQDHASPSGVVQFEVNSTSANGTGVITKVDGVIQDDLSDIIQTRQNISLSVDADGSVTATFPSSTTLTVSAANFILSVSFTGDADSLRNVSKGLLGAWNGIKEDDFEFRNGTVLDYNQLVVTENQDILNNTLSERLLYPFGESWKLVDASESLFNYTGGTDTFEEYNPANASVPQFLEDLVTQQRNSSEFSNQLAACTPNGVVSTTCLYDFLLTGRQEVAQTTLNDEEVAMETIATVGNAVPNISLAEDASIVDGRWQAQIEVESTIMVLAEDPDMDDVTFSLTNDTNIILPSGIVIDSATGVITWTPTNDSLTLSSNLMLSVQAEDANGGASTLTIQIQLCPCVNNGTCLYNETQSGVDNYVIVGCSCLEAWSGNDCSMDRNDCAVSACYTGVNCTDNPAPQSGFECGDCPEGTTGDGRNCTIINMCETNPCSQKCVPFFNGFNCSCNDGYVINSTDTSQCDDVNECVTTFPCNTTVNSECVNGDGNFSCECLMGYMQNGTTCINIDECEQMTDTCNTTTSNCTDVLGSFECACNPGYERLNETICTDIDECEMNSTNNCELVSEVCMNTDGSFVCICANGFQEINGTCVDINECGNDMLNNCNLQSNISRCQNTEGTFICSCIGGYTGNGTVCDDIDECAIMGCAMNATCSNFVGGFNCTCNDGYEDMAGDCVDIDECTVGTNNCDGNATCENRAGSFACSCNQGYTGNGTMCTDIDECTNDPCALNATCTNSAGLFTCTCDSGFVGNGTVCGDSDECTAGSNNCNRNAICTNTLGSFTCACDEGYFGSGVTCFDQDECSLGTDNCDPNGNCSNTEGSFTCACNQGYTGDGITCTDIDECADGLSNCHSSATCTNTAGGFECSCDAGFTGNGVTNCSDVDECVLDTDNCPTNAICANIVGSFTCMCDTGFTGDGVTCVDINECDISPCAPDGGDCANNPGSFECSCNSSFYGDGFTCTRKPVLSDPLTILSVSDDSITILIDKNPMFGVYSVIVNSGIQSFSVNVSEFAVYLPNLSPNTEYTISAGVLSLSNGDDVGEPILSEGLTLRTGPLVIPFAFTLLDVSYVPAFADINSPESQMLISSFSTLLVSQFNDVDLFGFGLTSAEFISLRNGSTVASVEGVTNSTNSTDANTDISGVFMGSSNFSNAITLTRPASPQNVLATMVTTSSVQVIFQEVQNASSYDVEISCDGNFSNTTTTNMTSVLRDSLPSNSICTLRVRARSDGDDVVYSDFSDAVIFTTLPVVVDLDVSVSGTSAIVSFSSERLVSYVITATFAGSTIEVRKNATATSVSETIGGLNVNTNYTFNVEIMVEDAGRQRNAATDSLAESTLAVNTVSDVRIVDVTTSSFLVQYDGVVAAQSYTARVFLNGMLVNETTDVQNITITGVEPVANEYQVGVAFNTPAPSEFSMNVSSRIWNISETLQNSISLEWNSYSGADLYNYVAADPNGMETVNRNTTGLFVTIDGLDPGTIYSISVTAWREISMGVFEAITPLFTIPQITRPAPPLPLVDTAQFNETALVITWLDVMGADMYETSLFFRGNTTDVPGIEGLGTRADNTVTLTGLTPGANYTFEVCSSNTAGETCAQLDVNGFLNVPDPPRVVGVSPNTIELNANTENGVISYTFSAFFTNGTETGSSSPSSTPTGVISSLLPGVMYDFTVTHTYEAGTETSNTTREITAPETPMNLIFQQAGTDFIAFTWDAVATATAYRITNSTNVLPPTDVNVTSNSVNVTGLEAGTVYDFRVVATNDFRESFASTDLRQITTPETPTFNMSATTQTTILLVWGAVTGATQYEVSIPQLLTDPFNTSDTMLFYDSTNGVMPGQNYTVYVSALTSENMAEIGVSQRSENSFILLTTNPGQGSDLMELSTTFDSITVSWNASAGASSYNITASLESDSSVTATPVRVDSGTTGTLTGLQSLSSYVVSITAFDFVGQMSLPFGNLVVQTNPSAPVVNLTSVTATSIAIGWTSQAGTFLTTVRILRADGSATESNINVENNGDFFNAEGTSALISNLQAGTEYNISVTAFSTVKRSETTVLTQITVASSPNNLMLSQRTNDSLSFTWDMSTGAISYFANLVLDSNGNLVSSMPAMTTSVMFDGLEASTVYEVFVFASNDAGNSSAAMTSTSTKPAPPILQNFTATRASIVLLFAMPPAGTSVSVVGQAADGTLVMPVATIATSAEFTNIVLGEPYTFSLTATDSLGVVSDSTNQTITAPLGVDVFQVPLTSLFPYIEAYADNSSLEYFNLIETLVNSLNITFASFPGITIDISAAFNSSRVIIEFVVTTTNPAVNTNNLNDTFEVERNTTIFDGSLQTDLDDCLINSCISPFATCSDTPTSFNCTCNSGYSGTDPNCVDIDECAVTPTICDRAATCINTNGSFVCMCPMGFTTNNTVCVDVDECLGNPCGALEDCSNTVGSFTCDCRAGYTRNGADCVEINECLSNPCDTNAVCTDQKNAFACQCNPGYAGTGFVCTDIDECDTGANNCDDQAMCINTDGSFTCSCRDGYTGTGRECVDVDECMDISIMPCDQNATCRNTEGSFTCTCNAGYTGNDTCVDIDECSSSPCHEFASCSNSAGSFECRCNDGFNGTGQNCSDVDECLTSPCNANADCQNSAGSFACACDAGYSGDGVTCVDIDECSTGMDNCTMRANCSNTVGSFTCSCFAGYTGDPAVSCIDIDECDANPCNGNAMCINSDGSFACVCLTGYTGSGLTCTDINECDNLSTCNERATCTNTVGSFICACVPGTAGDGVNFCNLTFDLEITLSASFNFTVDLLNPSTSAYIQLRLVVEQQLVIEFRNNIAITDVDFFQGSVVVIARVIILNNDTIQELLNSYQGVTGTFAGTPRINVPTTTNPMVTTPVPTCANNPGFCDGNAACSDGSGVLQCTCNSGYTGLGTPGSCNDINECQDNNPCPSNSGCTNLVGSFSCECNPGTQNASGICIQQCSPLLSWCDPGSVCQATAEVGNPECQCQPGRVGPRCTDNDVSRTLAIVFGVLAGVLLIVAIVIIVLFIRRRRQGSSSFLNI